MKKDNGLKSRKFILILLVTIFIFVTIWFFGLTPESGVTTVVGLVSVYVTGNVATKNSKDEKEEGVKNDVS